MASTPVGVPTVKGLGDSFKDFGVGLIGGLLFTLAYRLFGGLGLLAAPLVAGSMIKGNRGEIIATMTGFMVIALGGLAIGGGNGDSGNEGVM